MAVYSLTENASPPFHAEPTHGEDGVVGVPSEKATEVLKRAQEIDAREDKMIPYIQKYKSLEKAIALFDRK